MNSANCTTLARIPLLFVVAFLAYFHFPSSASLCFIFFVLTSLTDWLDGYLARKYHITSTLGAFIDALIDKIFMLGIFFIMLTLNILPSWALFLVLIILGRELFVTGIRLVAATQNVVLAADREGKIKTVLQIVASGFLLLWYALVQDFSWLFPKMLISLIYQIGIVLFIWATYLTIKSGYIYTKRYRYLLIDDR